MADRHGSLELISDQVISDQVISARDDESDAVTIQMSGPNVVVRASTRIDRTGTDSVVHLLNSSIAAGVVVVVDPEQIRCSDEFASMPADVTEARRGRHRRCRPRDVETAADGVMRVAGRQSWWTIDIADGRFVRSDHPLDVHFIADEAWTDLQGVWISGSKLSVLTTRGAMISGARAPAEDCCTRPLAG